MKNIYKLLTLLAIAVITTAGLIAQPVAVTNGGFEDGLGADNGWQTEAVEGAIASFEEETEDVQEGTKAMHIYTDELGTNDWSQQFKNETFTAEKGKTYRFSMWVKDVSNRENGDSCKLSMTSGMTNAVDTWNEKSRLDHKVAATEWEEWKLGFVPSDADFDASLFAYMSTHVRSIGECLVDNFTVTRTQVLEGMVAEDGASVTVQFVVSLDDPAGNEGSFEVKVNDAANVVTALALDAEDDTKLVLTLTDAIAENDSVRVTYTPGTLTTSDGTDIEAFSEVVQKGEDGGSSAISTTSALNASIYPNPASSVVYLKNITATNVDILDATGRTIKSVSGSNLDAVNVSDLHAGLYFILINTQKGEVVSNRLVIK